MGAEVTARGVALLLSAVSGFQPVRPRRGLRGDALVHS